MQLQYNIQELVIDEQEIIDKDLRCVICLGLVVEPKECSRCQHDFCSKCIQQVQSICPNKCAQAQFVNCHRRTRGVLENIILKCPNHERGCKMKIKLNQINEHIQTECEYQLHKCRNKGCIDIIYDFVKEQHNLSCFHKVKKCKECLQPYKQFSFHDCIKDATKSILRKNKVLKKQMRKINKLQKKLENLETITLIQYSCNKNHQLQQQVVATRYCSQCRRYNKSALSCIPCQDSYCIFCKPPQIKKDSCQNGHQLLHYENLTREQSICQICKHESKQTLYDQECDLSVCKRCFDLYQ